MPDMLAVIFLNPSPRDTRPEVSPLYCWRNTGEEFKTPSPTALPLYSPYGNTEGEFKSPVLPIAGNTEEKFKCIYLSVVVNTEEEFK